MYLKISVSTNEQIIQLIAFRPGVLIACDNFNQLMVLSLLWVTCYVPLSHFRQARPDYQLVTFSLLGEVLYE